MKTASGSTSRDEERPELCLGRYAKREEEFGVFSIVSPELVAELVYLVLCPRNCRNWCPRNCRNCAGLAYFAYRPLAGAPWLGPFSNNPLDNYTNTAIAHEQLFFEGGNCIPNIGFFDDGTLKTEPNPKSYHRIPGHYDDDLMCQAVWAVHLKKYRLFGNDCQDWADQVIAEYYKLFALTRQNKRKLR